MTYLYKFIAMSCVTSKVPLKSTGVCANGSCLSELKVDGH